jgi:hypothetical protein
MSSPGRRTAVFVGLEIGSFLLFVSLFALAHPPASVTSWSVPLRSQVLVFVNLSLSAALLAHVGRRLTYFLPALTLVAGLQLWEPSGLRLAATPFPFAWVQGSTTPWWVGNVMVASAIGLLVVLIPATFVSLSAPRAAPEHRDSSDWMALVIVVVVLAALVVVSPHSSGGAVIVGQHLRGFWTIPSVAVFGLLLGIRRPWWPWVYLTVPFVGVWTPWMYDLVLDVTRGNDVTGGLTGDMQVTFRLGVMFQSFLTDILPLIVAGLIAASWQSLAKALRRLSSEAPRDDSPTERPIPLI